MSISVVNRFLLCCCITLFALAPSFGAMAQDPSRVVTVEPSAAQLEMNSKAAQAFRLKDYKTASNLFAASIALGELNITFLNLGRTYQMMGDCVRAKETFEKARYTRFKVTRPSPRDVEEKIKVYQKELGKTCTTGELVLKCTPANLSVSIPGVRDGGVCPTAKEPLKLAQGQYTIKATHPGYKGKELVVAIIGAERFNLEVGLEKEAPVVKKDPVVVKKDPVIKEKPPVSGGTQKIDIKVTAKQEPPSKTGAIIKTALGGVAILGGVMWDSCFFGSSASICSHTSNNELDAPDFGPIAMYIIGGVLALSGITSF